MIYLGIYKEAHDKIMLNPRIRAVIADPKRILIVVVVALMMVLYSMFFDWRLMDVLLGMLQWVRTTLIGDTGVEHEFDESEDIEKCARYYKELSAEFNLNELDPTQMSHAILGSVVGDGDCGQLKKECEGFIAWNGSSLDRTKYPNQWWAFPSIFKSIESFSRKSGLEPFEANLHTSDLPFCNMATKDLPHVVHSAMAPEWNISSSLFLPVYKDIFEQVKGFKPKENEWKPKTRCHWRGSHTGFGQVQSICTRGRTICNANETDRHCVVRTEFAKLDAHFGKSEDYWKQNCIAALDGNSWPSSFKTSLFREKLVLRVGGFNASDGTWLSHYEWFEPMLKAGVHYMQSTIDGLEATLETIDSMDEEELQQIAKRGKRAFTAITNETSLMCYGKLELMRMRTKKERQQNM